MSKRTSNEEIDLSQILPPYTTEQLPSKCPSDDVVNQMIHDLLDDTDIQGDKRKPIEAWTIEQKWRYITLQHTRDSTKTPSPEAFLDYLKANISPKLLESLSVNLQTARISWSRRFFDANGHLFLLQMLSQMQSKISEYEDLTAYQGNLLQALLLCVRDICNSKDGSKLVTKYLDVLPTIIGCFYPPILRTVELVMDITLAYLYTPQEKESNKHRIVRTVLETFRNLKRGKKGWKNLTYVIQHDHSANFVVSLSSFLNGLYFILNDYASFKYDWIFQLKNAGVIDEISKIKSNVALTYLSQKLE